VRNPDIFFSWDNNGFGESCCSDRGIILQIDNDSDFSSLVYGSGFRAGTSIESATLTLDIPPDTYYWRVRAQNETGGNWSETWSFILENTAPVCENITGPNRLRSRDGSSGFPRDEVTGLYNVIAHDVDLNPITYSWISNCRGSFQDVIESINIRFRGTNNGGYPEMKVVVGDPATGERSEFCNYTASDSWRIENCPLNQAASSIDIYYPNDNRTDRDLFVDYIELIYPDGNTRRIQSDANMLGGDKVIYDKEPTDLPFMEQLTDPYDGIHVEDGQTRMDEQGSLRFPVPLSFSAGRPPLGTCTLNVTAFDRENEASNTCNYTVNICGAYPSRVDKITPARDEQDVVFDPQITFDWNASLSEGSVCNLPVPAMSYTVYARTNPGITEADCPAADTSTYTALTNCTNINATTCAHDISTGFFIENEEYCWFVEADNGEYSINSSVWTFETEDPLLYNNWMTAVGGDIYVNEMNMQFPQPSDYIIGSDWDKPHAVYEDIGGVSAMFLSGLDSNFVSEDPDLGSSYWPQSQSGIWAESVAYTEIWPDNYNGTPPDAAVSLDGGNCSEIFQGPSGGLRPSQEVYRADYRCVLEAIDAVSSSEYRLQNPGTAVIYVTGSGELRLDSPFQRFNNPGNPHNVVFVTGPNVDVVIDKDLSLVNDPQKADRPLVEASFLVLGNFKFEGEVDLDPSVDHEINPDESVLVEGPVITKNLEANRNRGLPDAVTGNGGNGFPAEIISYNAHTLYGLTSQERGLGNRNSNYTNLFVVDLNWYIEE
jgi:hypothetical protein